jgi:hypothetical protein
MVCVVCAGRARQPAAACEACSGDCEPATACSAVGEPFAMRPLVVCQALPFAVAEHAHPLRLLRVKLLVVDSWLTKTPFRVALSICANVMHQSAQCHSGADGCRGADACVCVCSQRRARARGARARSSACPNITTSPASEYSFHSASSL